LKAKRIEPGTNTPGFDWSDGLAGAPAADVPVAAPATIARRVSARFGSLLVTLLSGGIAAALTRAFDAVLAEYLVLAAYLTVALGLPEAVNGQSLNGMLSRGNGSAPESLFRVYLAALGEGLGLALTVVASLFGLAVGLGTEVGVAGCIAFAVGGALCLANVYGLLVPRLLNHWRLNATVIGPPLALALTDITTLTLYFSLTALVLS
jgi:magnesium transporter